MITQAYYIAAGKSLAEARKSKNLTQSEIASRLGVKQPTIYKMETGLYKNRELYAKYAEALGLRTAIETDGCVPLLRNYQHIQTLLHHAMLPRNVTYERMGSTLLPSKYAFALQGDALTHQFHAEPFEIPKKDTIIFFFDPNIATAQVIQKNIGLMLAYNYDLKTLHLARPLVDNDKLAVRMAPNSEISSPDIVHPIAALTGFFEPIDYF